MKSYLDAWKNLTKEIEKPEIVDAFFSSIFYCLFLFMPLGLIFAQIISMYYLLLNLWIVLIMISLFGLAMLQWFLWKKTLILKGASCNEDIKTMVQWHLLLTLLFIVVVGLLFIFVFIPMMQR